MHAVLTFFLSRVGSNWSCQALGFDSNFERCRRATLPIDTYFSFVFFPYTMPAFCVPDGASGPVERVHEACAKTGTGTHDDSHLADAAGVSSRRVCRGGCLIVQCTTVRGLKVARPGSYCVQKVVEWCERAGCNPNGLVLPTCVSLRTCRVS